MDADYSQSLEAKFGELGPLLPFAESDRAETQHFIDVGEYGIALETMVAIILENEIHISRDAFVAVQALAETMEIEKEIEFEQLRKLVE